MRTKANANWVGSGVDRFARAELGHHTQEKHIAHSMLQWIAKHVGANDSDVYVAALKLHQSATSNTQHHGNLYQGSLEIL